MGLGFVLARFGIFLREFSLNQPNLSSQSYGLSLWFGTALIFLGVLVCLLSLVRYRRLLQQLQRPEAMPSRRSALAMGQNILDNEIPVPLHHQGAFELRLEAWRPERAVVTFTGSGIAR